MRTAVAALVVSAGVLLCGGNAEAAQCSISTTPVAFGAYDVFVTVPLDSTGAVIYRCNGGAQVIAITITQGQAGVFNPRKLLQATEWLGYNLYRDPARTVIWGNGTGGTSFYANTNIPNNQDISVPVYARVPPGQDVRAGAYADNVSVTVNF